LQSEEKKTKKFNIIDSFVRIIKFIKYNDACFSLMKYYKNGSLLVSFKMMCTIFLRPNFTNFFYSKDLINYHKSKSELFPYWFVLILTLEMLTIIDYLHKCKILHTDIKPDNFLIKSLPDCYIFGDNSKNIDINKLDSSLILIDFNRSIDQNTLPDKTQFTAHVDNQSLLCTEMKSGKSWSRQVFKFSF